MQEHLCRHFSSLGHIGVSVTFTVTVSVEVSVTFTDKTNPSDPLKHENFRRETLVTMAPYGVDIEDSASFTILILELLLALFILPMYKTL